MGSSRLTHEKDRFTVTLELVDVRVYPGERVVKVMNHITHCSLWKVAVVWKNHNDSIGRKYFRNEKPPRLVSNKPAGKEMGKNERKEEKGLVVGEKKGKGKILHATSHKNNLWQSQSKRLVKGDQERNIKEKKRESVIRQVSSPRSGPPPVLEGDKCPKSSLGSSHSEYF